MREDKLLWLVDRIYSTFGKPAPKQSSEQFAVLRDNLAEIPDDCMKFIARRATDLDDMPRNLTKFILACWSEWKAENPSGVYERCPTCDGAGGWTYFRQVEGLNGTEWHEFFSPCPECAYIPAKFREKLRSVCRYPWDLEKEGCLVVPIGYRGGVLKFMSDKGIGPQVNQNAFSRKVQQVKDSIAGRMTA